MPQSNNSRRRPVLATTTLLAISAACVSSVVAFSPSATSTCSKSRSLKRSARSQALHMAEAPRDGDDPVTTTTDDNNFPSISMTPEKISKVFQTVAVTAGITASILLGPAHAENELVAKYGGKFDASAFDRNCFVDKCSLQAKACFADDPSCRKGMTCTVRCLGDDACIAGCMARYNNENLDNFLKCTVTDNECMKIGVVDGGADAYGEEPRAPAPTIRNFNMNSLQGQWYKVVGYNPIYDCYACQKNTFSNPYDADDRLDMDVKLSMLRMMPDGTPPPPTNEREMIKFNDEDGLMYGAQSIGLNSYQTREVMVFDQPNSKDNVVFGEGDNAQRYGRTAHSKGEMFGLSFWENWYVIGENDPGQKEFKFVYYNGKTIQSSYNGAFVFSRTRELDDVESMKKIYKIASEAGMNPDQFCKIRNGCFKNEDNSDAGLGSPSNPFRGIIASTKGSESSASDAGLGSPSNPLRGIIASTKVSELLGVEPVAAEGVLSRTPTATFGLRNNLGESDSGDSSLPSKRAWWYNVGDYFEDPKRHYRAMDSVRTIFDWPKEVKDVSRSQSSQ